MRKTSRRKIFYTLVAVFVLLLPLILAYSLGYRLNLSSVLPEKTGGVFIKSRIPHLSIFLNNSFIRETSLFSGGVLLNGIKPGTYLLRIEKPLHSPWSKTVEVEPEMVTELRNIMLTENPVRRATSTPTEINILKTKNATTTSVTLDQKKNLTIQGERTSVIKQVHSYAVFDDTVFFINEVGFLARFDLNTSALENIERPAFYLTDKPARFWKSPDGKIIILDSGGGIFLLDIDSKLTPLGGGAKNIYLDEKGEKLLVLKDTALEIWWLENNPYQPFQKKGTSEEIIKINSGLEDARWFFGDSAHIVIKGQDGIFLTEIDGRGGRNTLELFFGQTDEIAASPELPNTVFFLKGKMWYKIEL